ncbi:hypothetical protein DUI87_16925 [Hirundo rustica rustica]|uniref:Uncharacterized protein n=1 Tax=Hirundo rustica rustica TaxID=333673 RepID=A0A3M0K2S4_HIRRU|nr:hypothetical protein DUI87_16925 [Hirundo rustica rustica]
MERHGGAEIPLQPLEDPMLEQNRLKPPFLYFVQSLSYSPNYVLHMSGRVLVGMGSNYQSRVTAEESKVLLDLWKVEEFLIGTCETQLKPQDNLNPSVLLITFITLPVDDEVSQWQDDPASVSSRGTEEDVFVLEFIPLFWHIFSGSTCSDVSVTAITGQFALNRIHLREAHSRHYYSRVCDFHPSPGKYGLAFDSLELPFVNVCTHHILVTQYIQVQKFLVPTHLHKALPRSDLDRCRRDPAFPHSLIVV